MFWTPILSTSCIILGVYIVAILLIQPKEQAIVPKNYHMGCLMVQQNYKHSSQIQKYIHGLKQKLSDKKKPETSIPTMDYFNSKGIQVAKSFQIYLNEYLHQKEEMNNYFQLSKATKIAYNYYMNCSENGFKGHNIIPSHCLNIWLEYQNCSAVLDFYKLQLNKLLSQKQQIQHKIKQAFQSRNKSQINKNGKQQAIYKQYQKQYKIKDRELEFQQKNIETNIKINNQKTVSIKYNLGIIRKQIENSKKLYDECTQHRNQYRLCEELSKQVRNLGYGSLESLSQKIEKKRYSIAKIQRMIQMEDNKNQKQQLQMLHMRSLGEYKKLHKIFVQIKAKIDKNCGCTQVQQQKLFKIYTQNKKQQTSLQLQIKQLLQKQYEYYSQLQIIKQKRKTIQIQCEKKKQVNIIKIPKMQQDIMEILRSLEKQQLNLKQQILEYQIQFSKLARNCEYNRQQLSNLLESISFISDCGIKKDYYLNLEEKLLKYEEKIQINLYSKENLVQVLKQFVI